ncbi:hypothetical protein MKW92_038720 [Papaver armeniacum]|nr:hypothetical protein MKW92_038720 [Papaver armeniacum]
MSVKYGSLILLHWGIRPILVVGSAETASEIMKTHDLIFADRLATKAAKMIFCGGNDVALAPYGERWRQLRKFCVLELLSLKRVQSFNYVREEEVHKVIEKIAHSSTKGDMINLTEILSTMSNSIIFRCSLGDSFNEDYTHRFVGLIKKATRLLESSFSFADFFPWLKWMDILTGLNGKLRKISKELDTFFNEVIDDRLLSNSSVKHSDRDKVNDKRTFIDILLRNAEKEPDLNLTRDNMKGIIMLGSVVELESLATTVNNHSMNIDVRPSCLSYIDPEVPILSLFLT